MLFVVIQTSGRVFEISGRMFETQNQTHMSKSATVVTVTKHLLVSFYSW